MEDKYTQHTVNQFFDEFKKLSGSYKIDSVHQLIDNPDAKAKHKVNSYFKHLKFIIMTSALIIGVSAIFLWFAPKSTSKDITEKLSEEPIEVVQKLISQDIKIVDQKKNNDLTKSNGNKEDNIPDKISDTSSNKITLNRISTEPTDNERIANEASTGSSTNIKSNIIESMNLIELTKSEYINLGFTINDTIIYHYSRNGECIWKIYFSKIAFGCGRLPFNTHDTINPNFIFLSDLNGFQNVKWRCGNNEVNKWDDEYFKTKIQELIPIVLRQSDFPDLLIKDFILWFEPSEKLFSKLPPRISNDLKSEYYTLISKQEKSDTSKFSLTKLKALTNEKTSSCRYFEACKSTLEVGRMNIYPNPAYTKVTIEFSLDAEVKGSVLLVNISGNTLKTLIPNSTFPSGFNKYQMDLSGVTPGIYLISINTDKGFKTQRIIVAENK